MAVRQEGVPTSTALPGTHTHTEEDGVTNTAGIK